MVDMAIKIITVFTAIVFFILAIFGLYVIITAITGLALRWLDIIKLEHRLKHNKKCYIFDNERAYFYGNPTIHTFEIDLLIGITELKKAYNNKPIKLMIYVSQEFWHMMKTSDKFTYRTKESIYADGTHELILSGYIYGIPIKVMNTLNKGTYKIEVQQ